MHKSFCDLHAGANSIGLLLLGEISTCLRNTTPVYQYSVPTRFWLFLGNWLESLAVFATLNSILTENRQAKPGRFQIRSLKKKLHLSHSGNNVQNTYFPYKLFIFRFSDVLNGFNSSVRRCKSFFQGAGFVSVISLKL